MFASGLDAVASLSSISLSVSSSGFLRLKSAILFVLNYIWSECESSSDGGNVYGSIAGVIGAWSGRGAEDEWTWEAQSMHREKEIN